MQAPTNAANVLNRLGIQLWYSKNGSPIKSKNDEFHEYGGKMKDEDYDSSLREYYVFPEAFKNEICKGFDHKAVASLLLAKGCLDIGAPEKNGYQRLDKKARLPGMSSTRCYVIKPEVFGVE